MKNEDNQKQLSTALGAIGALSGKTDEVQNEAIRKSPEYLRVKDELFRLYDDFRDCLAETLKPLGIDVVQVQIRSAIPGDVRGLYEKLAAMQIVPEVKVGATKTDHEVPSWLEGNLCQ